MTLLVRDEKDIIRENIEYHLAQGIDFFIATDNESVDGTSEILKEYESKGLLKYHFKSGPHDQSNWVTEMAKEAYETYGADWVINNDADEFWYPKVGTSLKDVFLSIDEKYNILVAERSNFIALARQTSKPFYETMIYREKYSKNPIGDPLPPKVAHRGVSDIIVATGNHSVKGFEEQVALHDTIEVFHFPMRSIKQYESKMIHLGSGFDKANKDNLRRDLYLNYLEDNNFLKNKFNEDAYSTWSLILGVLSGTLVKDTRLKNFFESRI